jgi:DNA-binding CsgD family transcriptional regulator
VPISKCGTPAGPAAKKLPALYFACSARVRAVLRRLPEGDSDEQIAARPGISRHTVNQYTKAIYRRFGASARSELLARWVRRGWGARFAWAGDPGQGPPAD